MTERVMELLEGPMIDFTLDAFSLGAIVSIIAILLGYAVSKALSLIDI
ncbi:MAG: hypothetical protein OSJ71_17920 [Acetatifactor sp.]|nr:hypothetical protein [Acetatifactor sp.]